MRRYKVAQGVGMMMIDEGYQGYTCPVLLI